ncbi:sulfurtransferase [Cumulibacter soli]|uniref:sulfurtransferase n=1 Tax=Cumulibacter soli TaxID=2546344 RepID=UPI00106785F1|nr:rhodanese-like domain-containing protein [Cumulibacter soli]
MRAATNGGYEMTESFPLLVSAAWLNEHLDSVKVLDCTTHMVPQPVGPSKISSGRPDFDRGHIPGADHVDMVEDLSDPDGEFPYTLPGSGQIEQLLGSLAIQAGDHIVLYTTGQLMVATRAWYVLRAMGHERVSILNGGLQAWTDAGYPVETSGPGESTSSDSQPTGGSETSASAGGTDESAGAGLTSALGAIATGTAALGDRTSVVSVDLPQRPPSTYSASPDQSRYAGKADVAAAADGTVIVNALSAEQYAGTGGAHYGRPGRIPGSVSVPTASILTDDGRAFAPVETIRARFAEQGVGTDTPVITYCGGGIAATVDAFALALIGNDHWSVYDNSLLEWSTDPACPMETD